jgi:hypothetical protein
MEILEVVSVHFVINVKHFLWVLEYKVKHYRKRNSYKHT